MNNPFAAQPAQLSNPFAAAAAAPAAPAAPPPPAPTQGVAAIQAAFADAAPAPVANPFAPVTAAHVAPPVQYAPLNPPGEAGLGAAPIGAAAPVVEAIVEPDPPAAPKRRGRKSKSQALTESHSAEKQAMLDAHDNGHHTPDAIYDAMAEEAALDNDMAYGAVSGVLSAFTTDQLVDALISAGYTVTITKSKD